MRQVLRQPGWSWMAPVLAFPAVFWTFALGQNAFLTAALFGGFTLLIERRPALAGMCLGLLCYKPHFGLLAPVGLAAGGLWRGFAAAAATVAGLVLLSVAVFGIDTWQAYWSAFAGSNAVYASGRIDYAGIVTPFGAARLSGVGRPRPRQCRQWCPPSWRGGRPGVAPQPEPQPARRHATCRHLVGGAGGAAVRPAAAVGGDRLAGARRTPQRVSQLGKRRCCWQRIGVVGGLCDRIRPGICRLAP